MKHLLKSHTLWLLAVLMGAFILPQSARAYSVPVTPAILDSLERSLSQARTAADSIPILYNLYDANSVYYSADEGFNSNVNFLNQLYGASVRAGKPESAFDAVRYIASISRNDHALTSAQLKRLESLPLSDENYETRTYINLQNYFWALRDTTLTPDERRRNFHNFRTQVERNKSQKSLYDRLTQQFALVMYGSNLIEAEKMENYLHDLEQLVLMTKDGNSQLKGYYYRIAALLYDENENGAMSVKSDSMMLKIYDERNHINAASGRIYRDYRNQLFVIYRRMLSNYPYLSEDHKLKIYNELNKLMAEMPESQLTQADRKAVSAMWNMQKGNYADALDDLRVVMSSVRYKTKANFINAYLNAARATGSLDDLDKGYEMYIGMLLSRAKDAADTESVRMRIEYEIDTLEANTLNSALLTAAANKKTEEIQEEYYIYGLFGLGLFIIAVLVVTIMANRKVKHMTEQLEQANEVLVRERDELRKTKNDLEQANAKTNAAVRQKAEYIYNVSHEISEPVKAIVGFTQIILDSIPEERRHFLEGFVDIINHNSRNLQRIVNDLLSTAEGYDNVTNITVSRFHPGEICELVAENFRPRLNPGQKIEVQPVKVKGVMHDAEVGVDSDAGRLEQILINLVGNAVKFSNEGKIIIAPEVDYEKSELRISVSDEGPGIDEAKAEAIFGRFENMSYSSTGLGLGLYVSRQLARMMKGDVKIDTTYTKGARFIVSLPSNLSIINDEETAR